jgi:hypothetical protein
MFILPLHISECTHVPFRNSTNSTLATAVSGSSYVASFTIPRHVEASSTLLLKVHNITMEKLNPEFR